MQTSTLAAAAAAAALVYATACGPVGVDTTGGEGERTETAPPPSGSPSGPPSRPPGGQGEQEGSDSGPGRTEEPGGGAAVHLPLGGSHTFADGFSVSMGPVERRTEGDEDRRAPREPGDGATPREGPPEGGESPDEGESPGEAPQDGPSGGESPEDASPGEEGTGGESPGDTGPEEEGSNGESPEDTAPEEEESGGESPGDTGPAEEESEGDGPAGESPEEVPEQPGEGPGEDEWGEEETPREPQYDALHYFAWTVTATNGTGAPVHTGSPLDTCAVGDPLQESIAPAMGESVDPPRSLAPGRSGSWDADCLITEGDVPLQWTLEFYDEEGEPLYPPLVFSGDVP